MQNKIILFDIDHTIFDTDMYLESAFDRINQIFSQEPLPNLTDVFVEIYTSMRAVEVFHPKRFATLVTQKLNHPEKLETIIGILEDQSLLDGCIFSDVSETLQNLTRKGIQIGIFSTGEKIMQKRKIHSLRDFFSEKDINIFPLKDKEISSVVKEYFKNEIIFVDDRMNVLEEIHKYSPSLTTICIRRKKPMREHPASRVFEPTFHIKSLKKVLDLV